VSTRSRVNRSPGVINPRERILERADSRAVWSIFPPITSPRKAMASGVFSSKQETRKLVSSRVEFPSKMKPNEVALACALYVTVKLRKHRGQTNTEVDCNKCATPLF